MNDRVESVKELREIREGVYRALVDIWRGAKLIRDGADITEEHKTRLQSLVADLDAKIAANEDRAVERA